MPWKAFLRLFIALSVISAGRSQNFNRAECVNVTKDSKFNFKFLPKSLESNQAAWENAVRKITNYTNNCLRNHLVKNNKTLCKVPVITITYPVISLNPRIPLQVLPKPYLATKEGSTSTDSQVLTALGQIWKLFVFCLMAAVISGIIIWFLDHKINSGHFPKSFWSGTREGLWWAIVTMTTVGYGDKTPKSFLGRVYASLWMVVGMLLMSCITAQISSTITTDDLRPLDDKFGQNIGVPNGSKKFFEPLCPGAKLIVKSTEESLFNSLQDGKVDKIYLFDCKEKQAEKRELKIVYVLSTQPVIGAEVQLVGEINNRKLKKRFDKCLEEWAVEYEDDDVYLEPVARKILKEEGWESKIPKTEEKQRRCIVEHRRGRYHDDKLTTPQLGLIDILLCTAAGLLITLLTTGTAWDTCVKLRHKRKSLDNNADIEKAAGTQELQSTPAILN